ncbi:unnamed protein product [Cyclocybe aegerita]|uniref:DUF6534 domain-containing protein n=1 Tax=Cyclocybe aegerita TaxID=1973307 RepID=A0A8S0W850_CYCAE|nr:unnamed protein product [Cyclocybe aegerita]
MSDIGTVKFNTGAILIGSYVNLVLYTLELFAFRTYLRCERSCSDRKSLKVIVFSCVFIDTIGTFAACAVVFTDAVVYWGDPSDLGQLHWTNALWFVSNQVVALVVQGFMVTRYFKLSHNYIVTIIIFLFMLASFACSIQVAVVSSLKNRTRDQRVRELSFITVVLVGALITDALITIALIWLLRIQKVYSDTTKSIVRRLSSLAIRSGLATCVVVLATFITFAVDPSSSLSNGIAFVVARVYSLTMLFTLNSREGICEDFETHFETSGSIVIEPHTSSGSPLRSESTETLAGPATPLSGRFKDVPITFAQRDDSSLHRQSSTWSAGSVSLHRLCSEGRRCASSKPENV